jgi:hypothetical protein
MELKFTRNQRGQHGLSPSEVEAALAQLVNLEKTEVNDTCGVHVHVDVRDLTVPQLNNVIGLYLVVERSLYRYCGVDRTNNNFCVPLHKALGGVAGVWHRGVAEFRDELRYGGLNLHAVRRFGTLEFRMHPGSNDINKIVDWMNICAAIKENGKDFEGPKAAYQKILGGPEVFMTDIFGSKAPLLMHSTLQLDLERGLADSKDMMLWTDVHFAQQKIRSRRSRKKEGTLWAQWAENCGVPIMQQPHRVVRLDELGALRAGRLANIAASAPITFVGASPPSMFFDELMNDSDHHDLDF